MLLEPMSASSRLLYRLNMIFGSRLRLAGEKRSQYVYIAGYFKTPDKHVKCVSNCWFAYSSVTVCIMTV